MLHLVSHSLRHYPALQLLQGNPVVQPCVDQERLRGGDQRQVGGFTVGTLQQQLDGAVTCGGRGRVPW